MFVPFFFILHLLSRNIFLLSLKNEDNERKNNIQRVIDNILLKCTDDKYRSVAEYLQNNIDEIICELNLDYERSILLQRHWKEIIVIVELLQVQAKNFYLDLSKQESIE